MKKHQDFLEFNGKAISILNKDGVYYIPLKPICDALNIDADRSIKNLKNDPILGPERSKQTVQVSKNGKNQGRILTCLPEKFIYGWIFSLNSSSQELIEYKRTCYNLLYEHFHGSITGRKEVIEERSATIQEIEEAKKRLEQIPEFIELRKLENKKKQLSHSLNVMDREVEAQFQLKLDEEQSN
jgi:hypothetical protein